MPDDAELRRRSTEHGPSVLPPPAEGLRSGAPLVYLDQHVWVRLLKGGPAAVEQLGRLRSAVDNGLVVTCLSAAHYAETWHRGAWVSRWALARLLWDTSRLVTLAPLHALQASEIELAMSQVGAIPATQVSAPPVVGLGVNHAFASPTGRLRLLDSVGPDGQEGSELPLESRPAEERLTYASGGRAYEWFSLAGLPCDMRLDGLDLTTQRREGAAFVAGESRLAELLRIRHPSVTLGEAVAGDGLQWIWDDLRQVCEDSGVEPDGFLRSLAASGGRPAVEAFIQSMPTFGLLHDLRVLRHQNPQQPWHGNDRRDLLALAVATTYCQGVATEGHWTHLMGRLNVDQRTGCHVGSSLAGVLDHLGV